MVTDISLALVEMGCDVTSLPGFLRQRRHKLNSISSPGVVNEPNKPRTLQVGDKRNLPNHVPEYFPPFPDSHWLVARFGGVRQSLVDTDGPTDSSTSSFVGI